MPSYSALMEIFFKQIVSASVKSRHALNPMIVAIINKFDAAPGRTEATGETSVFANVSEF
jgi:hypothetical protein